VHELAATPLEKLIETPGIGEKTAAKLLAAAAEYLAAHPPVLAETLAAEMEFTPEMEAAPEAPATDAAPAEPAAAEEATAVDAPASEGVPASGAPEGTPDA